MDNFTIAQRLREYAKQLEGRQGNLYRIRAYRRAALTVLSLDRPVAQILADDGARVLQALPGVGAHLAFTIEHLVRTGDFLTFEERSAAAWRPSRRQPQHTAGSEGPAPRAAG
jgi:holliday junction DNA helicase RuvA